MIPPIEPIRATGATAVPQVKETTAPEGFKEGLGEAIESVSKAEQHADTLAQDIATGGTTSVHDLMVATSKATLSLEMAVQVRNRAVEAYQEIMRMQL